MKIYISILLALTPLFALSQFIGIEPILENGDLDRRINIVILAEGYTEDEQEKFISDAESFSAQLFEYTPFKEYQSYFNVAAIKVASNESGADHPGTANDEGTNGPPVADVDTYFNSTFDGYGIHRLLVADNGIAVGLLAEHYPSFDQIVIMVNSEIYGGSGGFTAVTSTHASANQIAIHEMGHSFSGLKDEYYAGDQYAGEDINMTQNTDPVSVRWNNWVGDNDIGIHQHCCSGQSMDWYKPNTNCLMQALSNDFCSVCVEGTIEHIHDILSPVESYTPVEDYVTIDGADVNFEVISLKPEPNTLKYIWDLNGETLDVQMQNLLVSGDMLLDGENELSLTIVDTTTYCRVDDHASKHFDEMSWTILNNTVSNKDDESVEAIGSIFPNPTSSSVTIQVKDWTKYELIITNVNGQQIVSEPLRESNYKFDLSKYTNGVYYFSINNKASGQKHIKKVIKY